MIGDRIAKVRERIGRSAARSGRSPGEIRLIGVTKTVPAPIVAEAVRAGLADLGENRVQEAGTKIPEVARLLGDRAPAPAWHLIGHLQSNKAKKAAGLFPVVHSVDTLPVATALDRHAAGRRIDILLQVDLGHEPTKHGVDEGRLAELAAAAAALPQLRLRGLMTIPPPFEDPEGSRPFFVRLRRLKEALESRGIPLPELSMGMTQDFEVAIEEGATMVRVGRALFGEREAR